MKKLLITCSAIILSLGSFAQTDSTNSRINSSTSKINSANGQAHPDGVMMENGKMWVVKNGNTTILDRDISMSNGTKVMTDGTIIKKDGSKVMMKNGQHMDVSGNMVPMKTNKDKTMYLVPDSTANKGYHK